MMRAVIRVVTRQKTGLDSGLLGRPPRFFEGVQTSIPILRIDIIQEPLPGASFRDFSCCFAPFSFLSLSSPMGKKGKEGDGKGQYRVRKGRKGWDIICLEWWVCVCGRGRGRVRTGLGV